MGDLSNMEWLASLGNQLSGPIPAEIGNMSNLQGLMLEGNQMSGEIPGELGSLSNLIRLWLGWNELSGEIPAELGDLSNLADLHLMGNQLSGPIPPVLGDLSYLSGLNLSDNQLSGPIPTELRSLSRLTSLNLGNNHLSGAVPTELGDLTKLERLELEGNQLTGQIPGSFTSLTSLSTFYFRDNAGLCAPTDFEFREWLKAIEHVLGFACDFAPDRSVLVRLYNATDGANWRESANWLTDLPMGEWDGVDTDDEGRVIRLNLEGSQLSGQIPTELSGLSNLTWMNLSHSQLTGGVPSQLGNLSRLEWLSLDNNQLTGTVPPQLGNLHNLEGLHLSGNQLTGCIPAELRDVRHNDFEQVGLPFCAPQWPGSPIVSIAATTTPMVRIDSPVPVTATFSEPVNGLTVDDITVANGDVNNLVGSDGDTVYTFDVTPNAVGIVTVDIAADMAEDYEGNSNTAAEQLLLGLPYDDDHDGAIGPAEILEAVRDYFSDKLEAQHILELVRLYFQ